MGNVYQCCVRPVFLYCCETWELTVADEARLCRSEYRVIRMMCGVRQVDSIQTDVLGDKVGVVLKIENMIFKNRLPWYDHVMREDINSQICEVMEVEITGKKKKSQPRKSWGECVKKVLEPYGLIREMCTIKGNGESELEQNR